MGDEVLSIVLAEDVVPVGGMVRGWVEVRETPRWKGLVVRLQSHGVHLSTQTWAEVRLTQEPLEAGQRFEVAIELSPHVPHSHVGKERTVEWRLAALPDMRLAAPVAVAPLTIEPGGIDVADGHHYVAPAEPVRPTLSDRVWQIAVGGFNVGFGIVIAPVLGVAYASQMLARHRQRSRLRDLTLEVDDRPYLLGERVRVALSCRVQRRVEVERLTLTLRAIETWQSGNGNRTVTTHEDARVLLRDTILVPTERRRRATGVYRGGGREGRPEGPVLAGECWFLLPPEGPPTVTADGERAMGYEVVAEARLRNAPSFDVSMPLVTRSMRIEPQPAPAELPLTDTSGDVEFVAASDA